MVALKHYTQDPARLGFVLLVLEDRLLGGDLLGVDLGRPSVASVVEYVATLIVEFLALVLLEVCDSLVVDAGELEPGSHEVLRKG